jgi:DNA invertase Pin-like site-specific DNA recombinase
VTSRPPQIKDRHLRRCGVAYLRQSSQEQLREHTGSTAIQRDLPLMLQDWGWPSERVSTIDEDLGVTGSIPGLRHGFARLLNRIQSGEIGIVAVTDSSRLVRNHLDFGKFAQLARKHDVLLALSAGQVIDFSDPNAEFIASILMSNAVRENRARADMGRQARQKKALQGHATTSPPVGYVRTTPGEWDKHPDPRVRDAVQLLFDKFIELGTEGRVIRWMRSTGLDLPCRAGKGLVRWSKPRRGDIIKTLRNPAYKGVYVYGRTAVDERDDLGRTRVIRKPASDWTVFENHHPAYVTAERWAEIQERLNANRSKRITPAGRGNALAQGLLRCRNHGTTLRTLHYSRSWDERGLRKASYVCQPFMGQGDATYCCGMRAGRVDEVVETEILHALSPPSLDTVKAAAREALREHEALVRGRHDELRRAEQAVAEAERAYDQTPADRTHLKERLAQRFDDALRRVKELQTFHRLHPLVAPLALNDEELRELTELLTDLPRLWRHPAVSAEDRKAIVRQAIKVIEVTPSENVWTIEIEWVGGASTSHNIPNHQGVRALIRETYANGLTDTEIVAHLRTANIVQRAGKLVGRSYTLGAVRDLIRRMKLQRPFDAAAYPIIRVRCNAAVTYQAIADELNATGIRHRLGRWNRHRVATAVERLRSGRVRDAGDVPRLPALKPRVLELHKQKLSPRQIAEKLQAEGVLTWNRTPVTINAVWAVFRQLGLRAHAAVNNDRVADLLKKWTPTMGLSEMAEGLNDLGLSHMRGGQWTARNVKWKLNALGIPTPDRRPSAD